MANEQNLIPIRKGQLSKEEAKKRGAAGGKKQAANRRKRKLLSQIYAEMLADTHEIEIKGKKKKLTGDKFVSYIASEILKKKEGCSVSMLKEVREATEGTKSTLKHEGLPPIQVTTVIDQKALEHDYPE